MSSSSIAIRFIKANPFLEEYLRLGLINYSALARLIRKKFPQSSEAAVGMSLRRFARRDKAQKRLDTAIFKIVGDARVKIENKTSVVIIHKPPHFAPIEQFLQQARRNHGECTMIEGSEAITLIFSTRLEPLIEKYLAAYVMRIKSGFAKIVLTIDERLEETPGVVSFVYGQLSKAGINIHEEMSCWHDIMMVIHERDVGRALSILTPVEEKPQKIPERRRAATSEAKKRRKRDE